MARKNEAVLEEKKVIPPHQRPCDYCGGHSVGTVAGRSHCRDHAWQAMDGVSPTRNEPQKYMAGVQPKQVAGRD